MTNNNLRAHISWLLTTKPFVPPPPRHTALPINDEPPDSGFGSSGELDLHHNTHARNVNRDQDTPLPTGVSETTPRLTLDTPSLPGSRNPSGVASSRTTEMARLRVAPSSGAKPRLIQEQSRSTSRTPRSPQKTEAQTPLSRPGARQPEPSFSRTPVPRATFGAKGNYARLNGISLDDSDVDTIDLTGDSDGRTDSSPVINARAQTSRKRKSTDFEDDFQANQVHQRRTVQPRRAEMPVNDFVPIEDLEGPPPEDPPPPYSSVAGRGSPSRSAVRQTLGESSSHSAANNIATEREMQNRILESPVRPVIGKRKPLNRVLSEISDGPEIALVHRSPRKVHWDSVEVSHGEKKRSPVKTPANKMRFVADSEDEGEDLGSPKVDSPPLDDSFIESTNQVQAMSPTRAASTTRVEEFKDFRWHECKENSPPPAAVAAPSLRKHDKHLENAIMQDRLGSSTRDVDLMKSNGSLTVSTPGSQQASPSHISASEQEAVSAFSAWSDASTECLLNTAIAERDEAIAMLVSYELEYDEDSDELQARVDEHKRNLRALKELLDTKTRFCKASQEHAEIRARLIMSHEDSVVALDKSEKDRFRALGRAVTKEKKELELEIVRLLRMVGLLVGPGQSAHLLEPKSAGSDVVVRSTQTTSTVDVDSKQPIPDLGTTNHTQCVQQTQFWSKSPYPPSSQDALPPPSMYKIPYSEPADIPAPSSRQSISRNNKKVQNIPRPPVAVEPPTEEDFEFDEEDFEVNFEDDQAPMYSTNMGTPPLQAADDDEFDDSDIDDEEMLDVAEDIENLGKTSTHNRIPGFRDVFQETTGNRLAQQQGYAPAKPAKSAAPALPSSSAHPQYPWSRDVKAVLKDRFQLRGFRPHQLEAINATLAGKDCFVLMPTGGGKSLCYQLPSVIYSGKTRGVTVVISPLLSLMVDQVEHMKKLKIQAMSFNGETTPAKRSHIMNGLREPQVEKFIQLLYVAPEMLSKSTTMVNALKDLHQRQRLARLVIDEAHCVSQWGHDFRPDYKLLGNLRQQFFGVPVMALTATATENVKADTIHNLGISSCEVFAQSFNRPNLYYEIRKKSKGTEALEDIATTIKKQYAGQSGIVYCLSRKKCEEIAGKLQGKYKIKAQHYHAGMAPSDRLEIQKSWQAGKCQVIVATIAFGMGIDKPDVRFVIHHSIPKSLEGYYQETGRAGRDGKRSGCFLYYGYQDTNSLRWMITKEYDENVKREKDWEQRENCKQQRDRQYAMLRNVIQYCENSSDCRRAQVLAYFNEQFKPEDCNNSCDNCNSTSAFEPRDFTEDAITAISIVRQIHKQQVTILHCADVFRGGKSKKITQLKHDKLEEYGAGSHLERGEAERLFNRLVTEGALVEDNHINKGGFPIQYVTLGDYANEFGSGRRRLLIHVRVSSNSESKKPRAAPKKKTQTGVAAARSGLPLSTNVSSPIQATTRRRNVHNHKSENRNGYEIDDFVANDDEDSDEDTGDFEPIRTTSKRRKATAQDLGPPITTDEKMDSLTELHREVVENFVREGRQECEKIMMAKNLRAHPFTDTMLREMAINFSPSLEAMLTIPSINAEMVKHYGKRFLKLIEKASVFYTGMLEEQDVQRAPMDPNREIVEISDDDDDGPDDNYDLDAAGSPQEVRSSYFRQEDDPDVTAFNEKLDQYHHNVTPRPAAPLKDQWPKSGDSSKTYPRKQSRRSSSGLSKGQSNSRVTKKTTTKKREAGNAKFKPKRGGGSSSSGGGMGGIGMMPI